MSVPCCAICKESVPSCKQRRSLNPEASADNKRVVDFFVSFVNPDLQPAAPTVDGVVQYLYCCKACFSKAERAEKSLAAAQRMPNELRSKFPLPPVSQLLPTVHVGMDEQTPRSKPSEPEEPAVTPGSSRRAKRSRIQDSYVQGPQAKKKRYCSRETLQFAPRPGPSQQVLASPRVQVTVSGANRPLPFQVPSKFKRLVQSTRYKKSPYTARTAMRTPGRHLRVLKGLPRRSRRRVPKLVLGSITAI